MTFLVAGTLVLSLAIAQPAGAQDPGLQYVAHIPGARVTYTGPFERDHGARTYLYTVSYPARPRRSGLYEVWAGARSAGTAEVINGANYRAALKAAQGFLVFTQHGHGIWVVTGQVLAECTVEAGLYRGRNVMVAEVKAPTCKEAYAAATPAFEAVAEAIF
jgi:hypothetical protein